MAVDISTIGGLIESSPHNDNYTEIKEKLEQAQGDINNLNVNKAENGNVYTKSEIDNLQASDINNDASGVDGAKVSNALVTLNNRISNIIAESGTSDAEVVDARYDSVNDILYTLLKLRLDAMTTNINTNENDIGNIETNISNMEIDIATNIADIDALETELLSDQYSSIQQTFENVQSVPVDTVEAPVLYQSKGLSLANSVKEGDFATINEWIGANSSVNFIIVNNILEAIGTGNQSYLSIRQLALNFKTNDVWFIYSRVRVKDSVCDKIQIRTAGGYVNESILNPEIDKWYELFGKNIVGSDLSADYQIETFYPDSATANGKVMEIDGNAGVFAINMTQFGISGILSNAGYTTDEQQEEAMLNIVRNMDAGTTDIQSAVLDFVSVGKNLFDNIKWEEGYFNVSTGLPIATTGQGRSNDFTKVKDNTDYIVFKNGDSSERIDIFEYDVNCNFIQRTANAQLGFTTTNLTGYCRVTTNNEYIPNENIQFELGTVATEYENYKENTLKSDIKLKSLPNGVRDTIESDNWI